MVPGPILKSTILQALLGGARGPVQGLPQPPHPPFQAGGFLPQGVPFQGAPLMGGRVGPVPGYPQGIGPAGITDWSVGDQPIPPRGMQPYAPDRMYGDVPTMRQPRRPIMDLPGRKVGQIGRDPGFFSGKQITPGRLPQHRFDIDPGFKPSPTERAGVLKALGVGFGSSRTKGGFQLR